jgi:hypothetical protein
MSMAMSNLWVFVLLQAAASGPCATVAAHQEEGTRQTERVSVVLLPKVRR